MNSQNNGELPTKTIFKIIINSVLYTIYRTVISIVFAVFALLFLVSIIFGIRNVGSYLGLFLCLFILCFYSFRMYFSLLKYLFYKTKPTKILWNIIKWIFYAFLLYGLIATIFISVFSYFEPKENSTLVVLGAEVNDDGTPSSMLSKRIIAVERYLKSNPNTFCIASGGKGTNENISEAQCIYNELVIRGIEPSRIFIDDKSTKTRENIINSVKIIKENKLSDNLTVATDGFHQLRSRIIAQKYGVTSYIGTVNAKTDFYLVPTYYVREWIALPWEVVFH